MILAPQPIDFFTVRIWHRDNENERDARQVIFRMPEERPQMLQAIKDAAEKELAFSAIPGYATRQ